MLDIGLGEGILIAVIGLLIFGPERLPKVAADAARTLRQARSMASAARRDLADAAGLDELGDMTSTLREIRDLDPRRVLEPLEPDPAPRPQPQTPQRPAGPAGDVAGAGPDRHAAAIDAPAAATAPVAGGGTPSMASPGGRTSDSADGPDKAAHSIPADPDWS